MSNLSIFDELVNKIFDIHNIYTKENKSFPRLCIDFSNDGYMQTKADKGMISTFGLNFNDADHLLTTVFGYPFTINEDQQEPFKVRIIK